MSSYGFRLSAGKALFTTDVEGAGGRVFLFGDSSCADDAAQGSLEETEETRRRADCLWLFKSAVRYACEVICFSRRTKCV